MALSEFEIAMGGITSIPMVGGLIYIGYKTLGESSLDVSKLKSKKKPAEANETPKSDKKASKENSQKIEKINTTTTNKEETSSGEKPKSAKEKILVSSKNQPEDKSKAIAPNQINKQTGAVGDQKN